MGKTVITLPGYVRAFEDPEERQAVKESIIKGASHILGICEQIRFIYDSVSQIENQELKDLLTEQLIDAFNMGKKMNSRLAHYHRLYGDKTGHHGSSLKRLFSTRARKRIRGSRSL